MASCIKCGISVDSDELTGGRCSVCHAIHEGRKPTYTLPADEWDELTPDQQAAARADGISKERQDIRTEDAPSHPDYSGPE